MNDIERFEKVNATESLEELAQVIISFADDLGFIEGRTRKFNAILMAESCRKFSWFNVNTLTRNWGIRQQAMMLNYYENGFPTIKK